MTTQIPTKEFIRWEKVNSSCDHTRMTETLNETTCCFCCKLMTVVALNHGCTNTEFSNQYVSLKIASRGDRDV